MTWPDVVMSNVDRLRVLAAARPHLAVYERVIDAPFERVWAIAGDLEGAPSFEVGLGRVRILERRPDSQRLDECLELEAAARFGPAGPTSAVLRPGFCLMWSWRMEIGLAAAPAKDPGQTLFLHFEGIRGTGPLLRPLFRLKVKHEVGVIARLAGERKMPS